MDQILFDIITLTRRGRPLLEIVDDLLVSVDEGQGRILVSLLDVWVFDQWPAGGIVDLNRHVVDFANG